MIALEDFERVVEEKFAFLRTLGFQRADGVLKPDKRFNVAYFRKGAVDVCLWMEDRGDNDVDIRCNGKSYGRAVIYDLNAPDPELSFVAPLVHDLDELSGAMDRYARLVWTHALPALNADQAYFTVLDAFREAKISEQQKKYGWRPVPT